MRTTVRKKMQKSWGLFQVLYKVIRLPDIKRCSALEDFLIKQQAMNILDLWSCYFNFLNKL